MITEYSLDITESTDHSKLLKLGGGEEETGVGGGGGLGGGGGGLVEH